MSNFIKITGYTILDQMRNRSFYVLLGISVVMVLLIRGCYGSQSMVNGQVVSGADLAWQISKIAFQVIAAGMFLMSTMLAMKLFSRDLEDGSAALFLARPVARWQYVLGRITGTWLLSAAFMFCLHAALFFTGWSKTGGYSPEFFSASLVCSINLLFIILCTGLLSLYLPDFISALFTLGVVFVGFISDGGYQLMNSAMVQAAVSGDAAAAVADLPVWRIIYPKVFMVQTFAASMISHTNPPVMGPVHPLINVALFVLILGVALTVSFNKKEI